MVKSINNNTGARRCYLMDIFGYIKRQTDAAVRAALSQCRIFGAVCVGISAAKPVENRVEIVSC